MLDLASDLPFARDRKGYEEAKWCELDPMVDYTDCERQAECTSEHLRWAYDQASDSYPNSETLPPTPAQGPQAQCGADTPAE